MPFTVYESHNRQWLGGQQNKKIIYVVEAINLVLKQTMQSNVKSTVVTKYDIIFAHTNKSNTSLETVKGLLLYLYSHYKHKNT